MGLTQGTDWSELLQMAVAFMLGQEEMGSAIPAERHNETGRMNLRAFVGPRAPVPSSTMNGMSTLAAAVWETPVDTIVTNKQAII